MNARELRRILRDLGCIELRQKGSHLRVQCGTCFATIPIHAGEDLKEGTLRGIEKQLEPCLGKNWLRNRR